MVETYSVQSTFTARDELTAVLERQAAAAREIGEALRKATGTGADAFTRLKDAGIGAFRGITDVTARLDRAMADMAGEAATAAGKFRDAGAGMAASFDAPIRSVSRLQDAINRLNSTPIKLQRTGGSGGGGIDDPFRIPAIPGGGRSWYSIHDATRAAGTGDGGGPGGPNNPWGPGGPGGASGAGRQGGHGGGFDPLMGGIFLDIAGRSMLDAIKTPIQAAASLQNERLSLQRQLGTSPTAGADYMTANAAAAATARAMPNITMATGIKTIGDLYSVTGSIPEAARMLTPMSAFTTVAQNIRPGSKVDAYAAVRSGEMLGQSVNAKTGQIDPTRLMNYLSILERAEVATHGRVDERQMLNFAQTGGMAAKNLTTTGLLQMIPVINELGGFRAGTAYQSMYANVVSGIMPERVASLWEKAGLLNPKMTHSTKTGIRLDPGAVRGGDAFQQNPIAWVEQYLIPALEKEGKNRAQIQTAISQMFSRQTGQRAAGMMAGQIYQIHKDYMQELQAVPTQQAVQQLYGQSFDQNVANLQGAWQTLMQQLGTTILPTLVPLMQTFTKTLQSLTDGVTAHPTVAKDLLLLGGGIAALGVAAGGALTAVGALRLALMGLGGVGGTGGAGSLAAGGATAFGTEAGATLAARLALSAGPIGIAIGAAMLAYVAGKALDDLISGSAGADKAPPRTGYHPNGLGGTLPGSGPTGSAEQNWLAGLWHSATTGTGGRVNPTTGLPPASTGGVIALPAPTAAPAASPATSSGPHGASSRGDHHALTAAVAAGVQQGMSGATVHMDGNKVGAIVLAKINNSLKQPRKGTTSRDNRMNPSKPSQAVKSR